MRTRVALLAAVILAALVAVPAASASAKSDASWSASSNPSLVRLSRRALPSYFPKKRHVCRKGYAGRYVKVKVRHHKKKVRRFECIGKPVKPPAAGVKPRPVQPPITSPPSSNPTTPAGSVRASIDPSYTQDPANGLHVTWAYSASDTSGDLPTGTLTLTVQEPNTAGSSGSCSMDVGGSVTGGTCTQALPHYGDWNVTVSYVGNDPTVAPATQTETDDIEPLPAPPAPPPVATTTSLTVGTTTSYSEAGPPPLNWILWDGSTPITVASSDPDNAGFVLSLTITGSDGSSQTLTGAVTTGNSCALQFGRTIGYNYPDTTGVSGCGLTSTELASGDVLTVSATSTGSDGYLPSTSDTEPVTLPWTL